MDWVKFFVESYVQLIGHVAWPVLVLIILLVFRKQIADKLRGLKKAGRGETFLEFAAAGLQEKISKKVPTLLEITEETYNWNHYLDALENWAIWMTFYLGERFEGWITGIQTEPPPDLLKRAMQKCNVVIEKIRKERPDSEHLELLDSFQKTFRVVFDQQRASGANITIPKGN